MPETILATGTEPRTDLTSAMGKEVVVYFRRAEELAPLSLPLEAHHSLRCRLVGVDRAGLWLEPKAKDGELSHVFVQWDYILSVVRKVETERAKEYRGLRPH